MNRDEIQLWLAQPGGLDVPKLRSLLVAAELARAARYRFAEDNDAFVVAHAMRRLELSRFLDLNAAELRFGRSAKGRPTLLHPLSEGVGFSASRRRKLVAFALAPVARLGVDVENVATVDDPEALLGKFLDPVSIASLSGLSPARLAEQFAQFWTITEACAKARGTGLETFMPRLSVHLESPEFAVVEDGSGRWRCHLLTPDDGHRVAVAYAGNLYLPLASHDWVPG